jgi:hypothetical protein
VVWRVRTNMDIIIVTITEIPIELSAAMNEMAGTLEEIHSSETGSPMNQQARQRAISLLGLSTDEIPLLNELIDSTKPRPRCKVPGAPSSKACEGCSIDDCPMDSCCMNNDAGCTDERCDCDGSCGWPGCAKPKPDKPIVAWTGNVDGMDPPVSHTSLRDAERWIADKARTDPKGIAAGEYYIDVIEGAR